MAKATVFIVEDDPDIARLVRLHLEAANFIARVFPDGTAVIPQAERHVPKLFILDVMISGRDGLELCRAIRDTPSLARIPIIFLTAKRPFSPRELVARVKALLRRYAPPPRGLPVRLGELEVDPGAMTLTVRGKQYATTSLECRLLHHFVQNIGRVFTRDQILDLVWGLNARVGKRSVDVYVRRVREKIERDPDNPVYLKTVRGSGYRFDYADH